ncbi:MAG: FAD-dependent monooxygenase, partial [Gammaproteobacteria bacterium]
RLGAVVEVDRRLAFPLRQHVVADFNPLDRVLLIGDAARVIHPLAGLGANVGFEDVRDLIGVVGGLPASADLGTPGIWRAYARRRRTRARLMVGAMSGFKNLYAEGDPLLQWLRNAAVGWLNGAAPVKRQLIREALGVGPLASSW